MSWSPISNKHLFLLILKAEKFKIMELADSVSGESLICMWQQGLGLLNKILFLFMRAEPHDLITSQKPELLIPSLWKLRCQHMNLQGLGGERYKLSIVNTMLFVLVCCLPIIK